MNKLVYLSLGSNLGDRKAHLQAAADMLSKRGVRLLRSSAVYETEPQDVPHQAWFLNAVLEAETELFPLQLLQRTQAIERELGRTPGPAKGPRVIDIDILLFGRFVIHTPRLVVPHPRLAARRFVLEPLAELATELRHPSTGKTVREMLEGVRGQGLRLWGPPLVLPAQ